MKGRRDRALHEVLRQMPYGVHVLGVLSENGEMNLSVVSWVIQCSFFPPLMAVAVRKPSRTYGLIKSGKAFTINLINKSDDVLVRQLVKPFDMVGDKLDEVQHTEAQSGAPILDKAFAFVECELESIVEPGDHALIIGRAVNAGFHEGGAALTCADMGWHYGG